MNSTLKHRRWHLNYFISAGYSLADAWALCKKNNWFNG